MVGGVVAVGMVAVEVHILKPTPWQVQVEAVGMCIVVCCLVTHMQDVKECLHSSGIQIWLKTPEMAVQ
jgi:hypothetical protein